MADNPNRLPRTAVPQRYELDIVPDLLQQTFTGRMSVKLETSAQVAEMVLNSVGLDLDSVQLASDDGQVRMAGTVEYRAEKEQAVLKWPQPVAAGTWTLSLHFAGKMADDLRGFYRTSVTEADGSPVYIACTQMEPTDARRVFPCWDEPDFKAVFAVSMVVEEGLTALSNGAVIRQAQLADKKKRVVFAETIPMSTYLLALVVGPLQMTDPLFAGHVPVRIGARPSRQHMTTFALTSARDSLQFFEDYFGVACPADKMDHVAIPDFSAGAMENLGCVTYRDELLLVDMEKSSPMERQHVVSTIAHETAHMWFGDLVTMRWWNGIWLNEAFATFMENLATDALHPEWDIWTAFGRGRAYALVIDALASTRPVEFPVSLPSEAHAMFDVLTYQKGGSILRMIERYLGPDVFRNGIQQYLVRHRYGNTETSDLWEALERASKEPVRTVMESWVFQGGYPLIQAHWNSQDRVLTLRQKPFRLSANQASDATWQVPIIVGVSDQDGRFEEKRVLLTGESCTVPFVDEPSWLIVNHGGSAFYRVAYDAFLWDRLVGAWPHLSPLERLVVVDDVWAAVTAGEVPLAQAVGLWHKLYDEFDPDVWGAVATSLSQLEDMADDGERALVSQLAREIAAPVFTQLGWEPQPGEDVRRGRTRAALLRLLGTVGADVDVRRRAHALFRKHVTGSIQLPPELLTDIARVVAQTGDDTDWDRLYRQFKGALTPQDESRYLFSLARFQQTHLVDKTLALYRSEEVRMQDRAIALGAILANRHAATATWEMLEANWDEIVAQCSPFLMQYVIYSISSIVDAPLARRTANWLSAHPIAEAQRATAQAIELQGVYVAMAERLRGHLAELI